MDNDLQLDRPRYFLAPGEIGTLSLVGENPGHVILDKLTALNVPIVSIDDHKIAPWKSDTLTTLLNPPQWRQLVIVAETAGPYEIGLCLMALGLSFRVYLALPILKNEDGVLDRLRQDSIYVLTWDSLVDEITAFQDEVRGTE